MFFFLEIKACVKLIQSLQLTTNINALNNSGQQIDQVSSKTLIAIIVVL